MKAPSFRYPGGKTKIAEEVIRQFPRRGQRYGEPFVGLGNIFWSASVTVHFEQWYLNDIRTCKFFQALFKLDQIDFPDYITKQLFETLKYQERDSLLATVLEPFITPFGCGFESGGFTENYNMQLKYRKEKCFDHLLKAQCFLIARNHQVSNFQWYSLDWFETWTPADFIYLDPPYWNIPSRTYTGIDHFALIKRLKGSKVPWILSGYQNPLYTNLLGEPFYKINTRTSIGSATNNGNERIECLWKGNL